VLQRNTSKLVPRYENESAERQYFKWLCCIHKNAQFQIGAGHPLSKQWWPGLAKRSFVTAGLKPAFLRFVRPTVAASAHSYAGPAETPTPRLLAAFVNTSELMTPLALIEKTSL
jgi:hypothetical protein